MDRKMVNFIKEQYPPGTRIRPNSMDDPYAPILPGTEGEVDFVDDEGQILRIGTMAARCRSPPVRTASRCCRPNCPPSSCICP